MGTPFLSEIRIFAFNYPPKGWALCNGQVLPISQNQALFALLGTIYGGNGQTTFQLPDLRGRTPMHFGTGLSAHVQGEAAGQEAVTLLSTQIPSHTHTVKCNSGAATVLPAANGVWATEPNGNTPFATAASPNTFLRPGATGISGGSQPHDNSGPSLVVSFGIALVGIFPSRN